MAPTINEPVQLTSRTNFQSTREGFALALREGPAPSRGVPSLVYQATSTAAQDGMPVLSALAALLIPSGAMLATPTLTPTPTTTLASSPAATPTATAATLIRFVGSGPVADTSQPTSNLTVTRLAALSGDLMVTEVVVYDTGANVPVAPAGWHSIRHDSVNGSGNKLTAWLYYKIASGSEPASYTWQLASQYAAGLMGAWRGNSATPIDKSSGAVGAGINPVFATAPSLTASHSGEWQAYFYTSQSATAPTISQPGAINRRANIKSTREGFAIAFGDLTAPPSGTASSTYVASASSSDVVASRSSPRKRSCLSEVSRERLPVKVDPKPEKYAGHMLREWLAMWSSDERRGGHGNG